MKNKTTVKPFFSVICPSFNHERYIERTLQSVFAQTFNNFEVVIVDDCSTDNTINKIFHPDNIPLKLIQNNFNMGISNSLNLAIDNSLGEYLCILATDDELKTNHLQSVYDLINKSSEVEAIYARLEIIDENDNIIGFHQTPNKSNHEHLRFFFDDFLNFLPAPGSCFSRKLFNSIGKFNPSLIQTQDFDFNLRVLFNTNISVLSDTTVRYRKMTTDKTNISSLQPWSQNAQSVEAFQLYDCFFHSCSPSAFNKIFDDTISDESNTNDLNFLLCMKAKKSNHLYCKRWGAHSLCSMLMNKNNYSYLYKKYKFEYREYINYYKEISSIQIENKHKPSVGFLYKLKQSIKALVKSVSTPNKLQ